MIPFLSITTRKYPELIRDKLSRELKRLSVKGIDVSCEEYQAGNFKCFNYVLPETTRKADGYRKNINLIVATALADLIVNNLEEELMSRISLSNHYYFRADEQADIVKRAKHYLDNLSDANKNSSQVLARKTKILESLREFLEAQNSINFEGFLNFRMGEYRQQLEQAVDQAVDDYLMEKEHEEFVRLLRYFVEKRDSMLDQVHVVLSSSGYFELFDGDGNTLENNEWEDFAVDLAEKDINYEDLLVNALITIAPKWITLHFNGSAKQAGKVETLEAIFEGRLTLCPGCSRCLSIKPK